MGTRPTRGKYHRATRGGNPWGQAKITSQQTAPLLSGGPTVEGPNIYGEPPASGHMGRRHVLSASDTRMSKQAAQQARSIKAPSISGAKLTSRRDRIRSKAGLPGNFDQLAPMVQTTSIAQGPATGAEIAEFSDQQARINITPSVVGGIRSVAPGVNCYIRFPRSTRVQSFPIAQATMRRRGTTFDPGATFIIYINHITHAARLVINAPNWLNTEIRTISKGLTDAHGRIFAFPNFVQAAVIPFILTHEGRKSPIARIAYISYMSPLRVHSETMRLQRARADGPLLRITPQPGNAHIGTQNFNGVKVMAIKFRLRKNVRRGCIHIRPLSLRRTGQKGNGPPPGTRMVGGP